MVVVCCVVVVVVRARFSYRTGRKVDIGPAKIADFSPFITKNPSLDAPNVKGCPKISIFFRFWTCLDILARAIRPILTAHFFFDVFFFTR